MTTIGIDPGKNGGIAWIADGKACVEKMPETLQDLWELIQDIQRANVVWPDKVPCRAYLEEVQPGGLCRAKRTTKDGNQTSMGSKSAFSFGRNIGTLEMALTAAGIPFERVRPQVWQKALNCMTGGDKNITKRRAQELFPGRKITHATADALLIAYYGTKQP